MASKLACARQAACTNLAHGLSVMIMLLQFPGTKQLTPLAHQEVNYGNAKPWLRTHMHPTAVLRAMYDQACPFITPLRVKLVVLHNSTSREQSQKATLCRTLFCTNKSLRIRILGCEALTNAIPKSSTAASHDQHITQKSNPPALNDPGYRTVLRQTLPQLTSHSIPQIRTTKNHVWFKRTGSP